MPSNNSQSALIPRPGLQVANSDLLLISLAFIAFFDEPVTDPWFTASIPITDFSTRILEKSFTASPGFSFLACLEQYQLCTTSQCSNPAGIYQLMTMFNYGFNELAPG
jgi:hypothetical protein